jgi:hypothetical protein
MKIRAYELLLYKEKFYTYEISRNLDSLFHLLHCPK